MYWKAIVVFLILLCIIAYNYHNSTIYPSINNYISNGLPELTTLSPMSLENSNDNLMTLNEGTREGGYKEEKDGKRYKNKNVILHGDNLNSQLCRREISTSSFNALSDSTKVGKILSRLIKKETRDNYFKVKRSVATKLQKKANMLGRLLIESRASNKSDEDDYDNDLDDDRSRRVDNGKINWDAFLNEDGPSIMELIVLNERHRKKFYPNLYAHDDEYNY